MKWLVPSKKSKQFGFAGGILKINPNPDDFWNNLYWGTKTGVLDLIMATMSKFTPWLSRNRQKIKKLSILINVFKKASTQTKPENFKSVCSEIIIYDLEKAYKDYNIFSTMYKKRKKIFIPLAIFLFFLFHMLYFNSSTIYRIYLLTMKYHKSFRRWKSERKLHSKLLVTMVSIEIFITGFK